MAEQTGRRIRYDRVRPTEETAPEDFASVVGERIRSARQRKGWTQVELAERPDFRATTSRGSSEESWARRSSWLPASPKPSAPRFDKLVATPSPRATSQTTQRTGKRRIA